MKSENGPGENEQMDYYPDSLAIVHLGIFRAGIEGGTYTLLIQAS